MIVYVYELTKGQAIFMGVCIAIALLIALYNIIDELRK